MTLQFACCLLQVHIVQTPQGEDYEGRTFHGKGVRKQCASTCIEMSFLGDHVHVFVLGFSPSHSTCCRSLLYRNVQALKGNHTRLCILSRSRVCRFSGRERPWSPRSEPCAKTSASAKSSSRPIRTQESLRYRPFLLLLPPNIFFQKSDQASRK